MEVRGYVYILKHPVTGKVHYVGFSVDPIRRSLAYSGTRTGRHLTPIQVWCTEVLRETGLSPVFDVIDVAPKSYTRRQCMQKEKLWIASYIQQGHPLWNSHI